MYVLDFNPVLVNLGFIQIRWYSIFYILGFLAVYFFLLKVQKQNKIKGFNEEHVEIYLIYSIIAVVVGARLGFFLFYNFSELFSLQIFKLWSGGMSFHGALVAVIGSTIVFAKKYKIDVWELFDAVTVPASFAIILGRLGNIVNGELVGTYFTGRWCTVFPLYDNLCRHPYPVYAMISHAILFGVLWVVYNKNKNVVGSKLLSAYFLIGYALLRIFTDIFKIDSVWYGVKSGQWLSIVMLVAGVCILIKTWDKKF